MRAEKYEARTTASVLKEKKRGEKRKKKRRSIHIKSSKERLSIVTQTHNLQIFEVIPFVKLQNNT